MAEKKVPLSIVIRTVDQATAKIQAINNRLAVLTKPIKDLEGASGDLREHFRLLGLDAVKGGFAGVGGAVKDLLGKVLLIGGAIGGAVAAFSSLVGSFDDLGDKAEALGTSADFLAQMRYAAERSGVSVEQLDGGLRSFTSGLGLARAGTGKLAAFLKVASPPLLSQLKAAKSNETAFLLLADAMKKIEDPAKRAAFAQKTLGDTSLAPLLARGSKGIDELRGRYADLAGSQEGAAAAAGKVDDSMKDLKAATDGIKAALVEGLSPALGQIVEQLKSWFTENRARIAEWASALGKKLPGAIKSFTTAFLGALDTVSSVIDSIGGIRTVVVGLVAVLVGPLLSSIYTLGAAILATPIGWILAGIAAVAAGAYLLIKNWDSVTAFFRDLWDKYSGYIITAVALVGGPIGAIIAAAALIVKYWDPIKGFFVGLWDGITSVFVAAWDIIKSIVDKVTGAVDAVSGAVGKALDFINPFSDDGGGNTVDVVQNAINTVKAASVGQAAASTNARITVDFANAPRGTRVASDPQNTSDVDLSVGYQMLGGGA